MASPTHHIPVSLSISGRAGNHDAVLADALAQADAFFGEGRHRIESISARPVTHVTADGQMIASTVYAWDAHVTDGTVETHGFVVGTLVPDHVCDFQPTLYTVECTICGAPA